MPVTYKKIASATVGSGGAANIEFTSIPSTYTDLLIKTSIRHTADVANAKITFNGSTANVLDRVLAGQGTAASSFSDATIIYIVANRSTSTSSTFGNTEIYIPNYASSNNKSVSIDSVDENNATAANMYLVAGLFSNSAAISTVTITPNSGNIAQYSTAVLYGISKS